MKPASSLKAAHWLGLVVAVLAVPAAAQPRLAATPRPAAAPPDDASACLHAIARVEPGSGLPPGLLGSIALVESGRASPSGGAPTPWPWAWNAAGQSRYAPDKATAVAEVSALLQSGVASVDVGCMQINLRHHPQAFPTLEQAFDPLSNIRYGAAFLSQLRQTHGDWPQAIARYHSGDPVGGEDYARRVALARLSRAWAGGLPVVLRVPGLCAPGMTPVLVPRTGRLATRGPPLLRCRR